MPQITRTVDISAPIERVFAFVTDVRNHALVAPPETREELIDAGDFPLHIGAIVRFGATYGGIRWTLASRITAFASPAGSEPATAYFRDEQIRGPFALWQHEHWFAAEPGGITRLTDRFTYKAPLGVLGRIAERIWLNGRLRAFLEHMHAAEKRLLEMDRAGSVTPLSSCLDS